MNERKYYKAINFDLDTKILEREHPSGNYRKAYSDLKRFFNRHQFEHRQGSGYVSKEKLSSVEIYELLDDLYQKHPWISKSVKAFDVTNVGNQYALAEDLRNYEYISADILIE